MALAPIPIEDLSHVLEHTAALWPVARGARIFLTGGTGFFGPWLVETFAHANDRLGLGADLVVLTRDPERTRERLPSFAACPGVTLWQGDVRDFRSPPGRFDMVIHGAAESSQQAHVGDHRHMFDTIVDGTRRTLTLARECGARTYLLLSSGAVYGKQPASLSHVSETFAGAPDLSDARSAYGEGKRAAEVLAAVEAESSGLSVRVARCFAFVGPHLPLGIHFAIGNFIRDAMSGGPVLVSGDGTAIRSYLYTADLAIWLWSLALGTAAAGPYNVGSEHAVSILETARAVADVCAPAAEVIVQGKTVPGAPAHRYVPSTERARRDLGLTQYVSLPESIAKTARWYQEARS